LSNIAGNCDHNIDPRSFVEKIAQNGPNIAQNKAILYQIFAGEFSGLNL
jgi:hypothetical protein